MSACEQASVDRDTLLYLKYLLLATVGRQARAMLDLPSCSVMESSEDPAKVFGRSEDD